MPTVGKGGNAKNFPYTPAGEEKAEQFAQKTGQPMKFSPPPKKGKKVSKAPKGGRGR